MLFVFRSPSFGKLLKLAVVRRYLRVFTKLHDQCLARDPVFYKGSSAPLLVDLFVYRSLLDPDGDEFILIENRT